MAAAQARLFSVIRQEQIQPGIDATRDLLNRNGEETGGRVEI